MDCEKAKLKANSLIDNEIDEKDISPLISHLESCYRCRDEYIDLLLLQRKMHNSSAPTPKKEWFEWLPERIVRRGFSLFGKALFIGSYLLLMGYALYTLFASPAEGIFVKLMTGGAVAGLVVLFGISLSDRLSERKTDRYRDVMK